MATVRKQPLAADELFFLDIDDLQAIHYDPAAEAKSTFHYQHCHSSLPSPWVRQHPFPKQDSRFLVQHSFYSSTVYQLKAEYPPYHYLSFYDEVQDERLGQLVLKDDRSRNRKNLFAIYFVISCERVVIEVYHK